MGEAKKKRGAKPPAREPEPSPAPATRRDATASGPLRVGAVAMVIVAFVFGSMWLRSRGQTQSGRTDPPPSSGTPPATTTLAPTALPSERPEAV